MGTTKNMSTPARIDFACRNYFLRPQDIEAIEVIMRGMDPNFESLDPRKFGSLARQAMGDLSSRRLAGK